MITSIFSSLHFYLNVLEIVKLTIRHEPYGRELLINEERLLFRQVLFFSHQLTIQNDYKYFSPVFLFVLRPAEKKKIDVKSLRKEVEKETAITPEIVIIYCLSDVLSDCFFL